MQRAATGLAVQCLDLLRRRRGTVPGSRVVLLVGGGDNGGDTLYAGSRLAVRGARVSATLLSPDRAHPGGLAALRRAGGRVLDETIEDEIARADLVLDGIVGIGGSPGLRPQAAHLAELATASSASVVAVDLPSGVDVDTGRVPAPSVRADHTVTFGTLKVCHLVDPAAHAAGTVHRVDIGLGPHLPQPTVEAFEDDDVAALLARHAVPQRTNDKYARGVLGLVVGSPQYAGASVLAASAALRTGLGMLRVVGEQSVAATVRSVCPEAVLADGRVQAWLAGPGMDAQEGDRVVTELLDAEQPVVLDAGALAAAGELGANGRLRPDVLLTPHAGELARLLRTERAEVEADRLQHVRDAADRLGATVLLKGSTTLVASPHGRVLATTTGTPWLATAGSGDVLAGIAGALVASGVDVVDAAGVAAHVHGLAGRAASAVLGSVRARDLVDALPSVLRRLGLGESAT
jgi:hydroxyethylthiazole kinase-like uncharacterized protein yjeF